MRVVVARSGSAWYAERRSVSTLSSQNNHTAVAQVIADAGHDVLCIGTIRGDLGIGEQVSVDPELYDRSPVDGLVKAVEKWKPDVMVNVPGSAQTCSDPDNPRGTIVQTSAWRYNWPMLEVVHALKIPRIIAITDMRCYPREQEMTWWPEVIPCAVLSQETTTIKQRTLEFEHGIHAVYAGLENFRLPDAMRLPVDHTSNRALDFVVLAHSHLNDGRINKRRESVWDWVLGDFVKQGPMDPTFKVYGTGWEDFNGYTPDLMPGPCRPEAVLDTMATAWCGPLIPMAHNWVSPKLRELALSNTVPLPYGRGSEYLTYDAQAHSVPLDARYRFASPGEMVELCLKSQNPTWRANAIDEVLWNTRINPSLLMECIEHFGRGGKMDVKRFGGYAPWEASST